MAVNSTYLSLPCSPATYMLVEEVDIHQTVMPVAIRWNQAKSRCPEDNFMEQPDLTCKVRGGSPDKKTFAPRI